MAAVRAHVRNLAVLTAVGGLLAACATPHPKLSNRLPNASAPPSGKGGTYKVGAPYQVGGVWYVPHEDPGYDKTGVASWYGDQFHMKATANGETFDMNTPSAAHTTLPLPSMVEVTNLENGRVLKVRVNDRGPFVGGRVIDLSREAARQLGFEGKGTANVRVRYVGPAPLPGEEDRRYAAAGAAPPLPAAPIPYTAMSTAPGPGPVATQTLAPLAPAAKPAAVASLSMPAVKPTSVFRVQAGAFSDPGNAQRVAGLLAPTGKATVEPVEHNGAVLYRVMVQGSEDEMEAFALRDRVAASGYGDARVIRPATF